MAKVSSVLRPPASRTTLDRLEKQLAPQRFQRFRQILISNWLWGTLIGAVALGLGLYHIGTPSLWFDEMLSVERASQPLSVLWRIVNASQPNMALYYFFLHGWLRFTALLGLHPTEAVVRFPSAVFAAGAAVFIFLLARRILGLAGGLVGAALYVFNTLQLVYTQDARSYALQLLLLALGWYALLIVLTTEKHLRRWLVCYIIAMALSVYTHFFSLLVLCAQGVALASLLLLPTPWRTRTRQLLRPLLISLVSITVLVTPMLLASRVGAQTDWIPIPRPRDVLSLFVIFGNHSKVYLLIIAGLATFGLFIATLASLGQGRRLLKHFSLLDKLDDKQATRFQELLPPGLVLLCWLFVPIVISYVLSQKSIHLFLSRYLVTVVPAFCLLAALGIMAMRWRMLRVVAALCLMLFTMRFVPQYYTSAQVEEWNTASFWVEHHYQPNDGLVCFDNMQGCQIGLEYYFHAYPSHAHFDSDSPGSFSYIQYDLARPNFHPDTAQALNTGALQKYAVKHPRLFYIVARLADQQEDAQAAATVTWLDSHYQRIASIKTGTVTAYLYNTEQKLIPALRAESNPVRQR